MNAAPRSVLPQRRRSKKLAANSRETSSRVALASNVSSLPSPMTGQKVEKFSASQQTKPIWLVSLLFLQRGSDLITFLLVAATLTIYSWTVYTQQQWSGEYRKLENLQREERQLTTADAVMKDQLAQQAEQPGTGLVSPSHANTIFLPPAPQRPSLEVPAATAESDSMAKPPLGY